MFICRHIVDFIRSFFFVDVVLILYVRFCRRCVEIIHSFL